MNDLKFWHDLQALPADSPKLGEQILEFAAACGESETSRKLKQSSWIYAGDLIRVLPKQPDPVKLAILSLLKGLSGKPMVAAAVRCIKQLDAEQSPAVILAAVDLLIKCGHDHEWQLLHAFFARSPATRKLVSHSIESTPTATLALFALSDPRFHGDAIAGEARVQREVMVEKIVRLKITPELIPSIESFHRQGIVADQEAQWLVSCVQEVALIQAIAYQSPFTEIKSSLEKLFLKNDSSGLVAGYEANHQANWLMGRLTDQASSAPLPGTEFHVRKNWLTSLHRWAINERNKCLPILYALLSWIHQHRESAPQEMVNASVYLDLRCTSIDWIPEAQRRVAIERLAEEQLSKDRFSSESIWDLLGQSHLVRRPSGQLDLAVIGALLNCLGAPTEEFSALYTIPQIAAAFLESPEASVPFFCSKLRPEYLKEILEYVNRIAKGDQRRVKFCTMIALRAPADRLQILELIRANEWSLFLDELQRQSVDKDGVSVKLAIKKIVRFASTIVQWLGDDYEIGLNDIFQRPAAHQDPICLELLNQFSRNIDSAKLLSFISDLELPMLRQCLLMVGAASGVEYGLEWMLAEKFRSHPDPFVAAWASERVQPKSISKRAKPRLDESGDALTPALAATISTCREEELATVLSPVFKHPKSGLVDAISRRKPIEPTDPSEALHAAVAALAVCPDPLEDVDQETYRFSKACPAEEFDFIHEVLAKHSCHRDINWLGHAFLYRWEHHLFTLAKQVEKLSDLVADAEPLKTPVFQFAIWSSIVRLANVFVRRQPDKFDKLLDGVLVDGAIETLNSPSGVKAAELLVCLHKHRPHRVDHVRGIVMQMIPQLNSDVRMKLRDWVSMDGISEGIFAVRGRSPAKMPPELKNRIGRTTDRELLRQWCADSNWHVALGATQRMLDLGLEVEIIKVLVGERPPRFDLICETIPYWSVDNAGSDLELLKAKALDSQTVPFDRFQLAIHLLQLNGLQNDEDLLDAAVDAINTETETQWFLANDWKTMVTAVAPQADPFDIAVRVTTCSQNNAYLAAVDYLLSGGSFGPHHVRAIEDFLRCGTDRSHELRLQAAKWLQMHDSSVGFPILASGLSNRNSSLTFHNVKQTRRVAASVLAVGKDYVESQLFQAIQNSKRLSRPEASSASNWILERTTFPALVDQILHSLMAGSDNSQLEKVAHSFKWGIEQGFALLSQPFRISVLSNEQLGYTRLHENTIYINILPIMKKMANGQRVVEGLILHELGHHVYHKGPANERIWRRAEKEKLHSLLNLVSDEHLERNLRMKNRGYDERLKQLASHAFNRTNRSYTVLDLLMLLGQRSMDVLTSVALRVGDQPDTVTVESGRLLQSLEKHGNSFARFFRALRMGLGNRFHDPKVEQALALFDKDFRKSSMRKLYRISLKLREIFQDDSGFCNFIWHDQLNGCDGLEGAKGGRGIQDHDVDREIRRITSREELEASRGAGGRPSLAINMIDEIDFAPINQVIKLSHDPVAANHLNRSVAGSARMLRQFLTDLGERFVHQRRRLSGFGIDRAAVKRLVTRQDPRLMVSRQREWENDLFIGVAIDCSGSMVFHENMELAKRFAALLAVATSEVEGIDLRMVGFTDSAIYDVGDKKRHAIHALRAGGGNNDAAALWHVAQLALRSKRKSRLLVMISDGLPTECSVDSLRELVRKLTKNYGMCCAQLAVASLEEVCFPNYVEVKEASELASIRKFGATIAKLVKQTIS